MPRISHGTDLRTGRHSRHARHLFTVTLPLRHLKISRDEFLIELRAMNIGASIHYAPLHMMPLYSESNYSR